MGQVRRARRRRRAHPYGAAVRRHRGVRHLRDGHPGRGMGWNHDHHRLRGATGGRTRLRRPRGMARQGRRQLRDRLRVSHDHRRGRRRLAHGHGSARRPRRHLEREALHGVSGRVSQRRRADSAGDAEGRGERLDDHDARRERHRDRRADRAVARAGATSTRSITASRGRSRWRKRRRIGRSSSRRSRGARCTSCTCPRARPSSG